MKFLQINPNKIINVANIDYIETDGDAIVVQWHFVDKDDNLVNDFDFYCYEGDNPQAALKNLAEILNDETREVAIMAVMDHVPVEITETVRVKTQEADGEVWY